VRTRTNATGEISHDNTIVANNIQSNDPTGAELKAGLVPAFLGGIVRLNGTYGNHVRNNRSVPAPAIAGQVIRDIEHPEPRPMAHGA